MQVKVKWARTILADGKPVFDWHAFTAENYRGGVNASSLCGQTYPAVSTLIEEPDADGCYYCVIAVDSLDRKAAAAQR